ncbi:MAG: putative neutral ceramidase superfamily lipid hydrolase [Pseudohongiellaceae bacterium]
MIISKNLLVLGFAFLLANMTIAYLSINLQYEYLHSENAFLENLQVSFLILAVIGFLFLTIAPTNERLIYLAIALLSFSFLLRELDMEHLSIPSIFQMLGSGLGRKELLVSLWTVIPLEINRLQSKHLAPFLRTDSYPVGFPKL